MFPGITVNLDIGRKKSILAVEEAVNSNQLIFLANQKNIKDDVPEVDGIYDFGVLAKIKQVLKHTDDTMRVLVEGIWRAQAINFYDSKGFISAKIEKKESIFSDDEDKIQALIREAKMLFAENVDLLPQIPVDLLLASSDGNDLCEVVDSIIFNSSIPVNDKQSLLSELDFEKRIVSLIKLLSKENNILFYQKELALKIKDKLEKSQKDFLLREQIKILSDELGDFGDPVTESEKYLKKIKKLKLPKNTYEKLKQECDNLYKTPSGSPEANIIRNYLDLCVSLPWNKSSEDILDIDSASKILNEDHFGLKTVKERILEFLSVRKLVPNIKGQIICLVGPPGVGKTSIARSLAKAIGKKYVRMSLGGLGDESEIRGHRKTYVGAIPGRIISSIKQCGTNNPLILLDEIDKLSKDYHGDPSSALLEVLDPEQNSEFYDRYLEVPFDLSKVLFIATANDKSKIPAPLYDRMEVIELCSYTQEEKFNIAKNHLVPKQLKRHGLDSLNFIMSDNAINFIIESYTREAGVRELERKISEIMRKTAKKVVSDSKINSIKISITDVRKILGCEKYKKEYMASGEPGIVNGLAWTSVGGTVLPVEVLLMKGKGKIQITGMLGDVMKESVNIAFSYIRGNAKKLGIDEDFYKQFDIHIHAPEGAIPKDGPSAGITIATALVSALTGNKVRSDVAMTGEITLKGKVLPIGGLKEKTMAAYKNGLKAVIIPQENESDLEEIEDVVKKSVEFIKVADINEVLDVAILK